MPAGPDHDHDHDRDDARDPGRDFDRDAERRARNEEARQGWQERLEVVFAYHERTKHRLQRYARSLGWLDWANQPDPFRRYAGAPLVELELVEPGAVPAGDDVPYADLYRPGAIAPRPLDRRAVAQLLYDSLALSAWKVAGSSRWSLRVNPSSGNLHPTEGYVVAPPIAGLADAPAVWHYAAHEHGLEQRLRLGADEWEALSAQLPRGALLVGLTSIWWREAWKYGERAFRYTQHDAGHAIAAIALAAAALGHDARVLGAVPDRDVAVLLGVHAQAGVEAEHPECLLAVSPHGGPWPRAPHEFTIPASILSRLRAAAWTGTPNRLSREHHPWPVVEAVGEATAHDGGGGDRAACAVEDRVEPSAAAIGGRKIVRQRRSAVDMDARTSISAAAFFAMLQRVAASERPPFAALADPACVDLVLFVHRVDGVVPGLYLLLRGERGAGELRGAMRAEFAWQEPPHCPAELPLVLLQEGDARPLARTASCHQDIAADGAFAAAMLARFEPELRERGPAAYRRLHHEAGAIGQVLYLEAEAAGVRATGIGCFFDDVTHEALGLWDRRFQVLYHFTVGGAVEDPRLRTEFAYAHRADRGA